MSAAQKPEPGTAVATTTEKPGRALAPEHQRIVDENRARNALVQQIRGTIWGKEVSDIMARAVAQYCRENQLDAVRHVEVLGGRIYLTAEFYDERGAELLRAGVIVPAEPDYINADARLDELARWATPGPAPRRSGGSASASAGACPKTRRPPSFSVSSSPRAGRR
jgi:hypothetical protein